MLEEDAKKKGISVNSLLTNLITKYAEWDRYAERFGFVTLGRQGFRSVFELMSDETLVAHGKRLVEKMLPTSLVFGLGNSTLRRSFPFSPCTQNIVEYFTMKSQVRDGPTGLLSNTSQGLAITWCS